MNPTDLFHLSHSLLNLLQASTLFHSASLPQEAEMCLSVARGISAQMLSSLMGGPSAPPAQSDEGEALLRSLLSSAATSANLGNHVENLDAFLENLFIVVRNYAADHAAPNKADVTYLLGAALAAYSDADGDGQSELPPFPTELVDLFWDGLVAAAPDLFSQA